MWDKKNTKDNPVEYIEGQVESSHNQHANTVMENKKYRTHLHLPSLKKYWAEKCYVMVSNCNEEFITNSDMNEHRV